MFTEALWYVLIGVVFFQLLFYWGVFSLFAFAKQVNADKSTPPISVIICAKNEAKNLEKNLPLLFDQVYTNYEVVVINDRSSDNTKELLETFAQMYPNLKIVNVEHNENFWGNKKYAITLGVKAAKHDCLLFTDADCVPKTPHWIHQMASAFAPQKQFVLGYGAYQKQKGFLNKLIRFETMLTAMQYFGWGLRGNPYMGVGRNMAYKKSFFLSNGGFHNHFKVLSGDDDLYVNEFANKANTNYSFHPDAFTVSEPHKNFKNWFYQKRRHLLSSSHYKLSDKLMLGLFYTLNLMFFPLVIALIFLGYNPIGLAIVVAVRYLSYVVVLAKSAYKLQEKDLIWWFPFLELFLMITQLQIFVANSISKPLYWKSKNT